MIKRESKGNRRDPAVKLPLNKIKLFSGKSKKAAAQPAEAAPPGAHKKKKRCRLKKRVVIPLAVLE